MRAHSHGGGMGSRNDVGYHGEGKEGSGLAGKKAQVGKTWRESRERGIKQKGADSTDQQSEKQSRS